MLKDIMSLMIVGRIVKKFYDVHGLKGAFGIVSVCLFLIVIMFINN